MAESDASAPAAAQTKKRSGDVLVKKSKRVKKESGQKESDEKERVKTERKEAGTSKTTPSKGKHHDSVVSFDVKAFFEEHNEDWQRKHEDWDGQKRLNILLEAARQHHAVQVREQIQRDMKVIEKASDASRRLETNIQALNIQHETIALSAKVYDAMSIEFAWQLPDIAQSEEMLKSVWCCTNHYEIEEELPAVVEKFWSLLKESSTLKIMAKMRAEAEKRQLKLEQQQQELIDRTHYSNTDYELYRAICKVEDGFPNKEASFRKLIDPDPEDECSEEDYEVANVLTIIRRIWLGQDSQFGVQHLLHAVKNMFEDRNRMVEAMGSDLPFRLGQPVEPPPKVKEEDKSCDEVRSTHQRDKMAMSSDSRRTATGVCQG
ncbi:uncharacterized protein J3D65DRAFT_136178 [Phyllosticta citribraziliensis]|uniref:Uncharacterized protein n=1 Tax=Phyllosticta citribraziliensis TaxID=989973 RepID=A0ABR1L683_9PEZI